MVIDEYLAANIHFPFNLCIFVGVKELYLVLKAFD